jgi:hypothetical protein
MNSVASPSEPDTTTTIRPQRPAGLLTQLLWLHVLLAGVMLFAIFSEKILGEWLRPEAHLLLIATATMICGCKGSVYLYTIDDSDMEEDTDGSKSNDDVGPVLTAGDAGRMPIMGSCVLFGLFCVYKYLNADIIKMLFTLYVVTMCAVGLGANVADVVDMIRGKATKPLISIDYFDLKITIVDVVGYLGAACMGYYYVLTKDDYEANWVVNNIFGVSFCLLGMKQVNISTYSAGCIMLSGLFFYDVFWVFLSKPLIGSNVMVTVAKGVKAPIKLMFPRVGSGMIYNATNVGMIPGHRTALDLVSATSSLEVVYNSSEMLGCKLTCIKTDTCMGMEWDASADVACSLFSAANIDVLVAGSNQAVQWFTKGDKFMPSMLGLGDIVVPGVFLSLLAKWDVSNNIRKNQHGGYVNYFNVAMVAYFLSLVCTLAAMIIWEAAQPALLYIVPFLIITSGTMALVNGELTELLSFEVVGAENNYDVASMVDRLTDENGEAKKVLTEDDVAWMKEALNVEEKRLSEKKKDQ